MRNKIGLIILFTLVISVCYITMGSFIFKYNDIKDFCMMINDNPFMPLSSVEQKALAKDFRVAYSEKEKSLMMIYDRATMGKTTCLVEQKNNRLEANYTND